jgi:hypothetical protein
MNQIVAYFVEPLDLGKAFPQVFFFLVRPVEGINRFYQPVALILPPKRDLARPFQDIDLT